MWLQKQNKKQDLDPVINLSTNLARCRVTSLMWFSGDSRSLPFEVEALGATHPDWAPHTRNFCLRSTDCFGDNWPKERIFSELHKRGGSSIEFLIWRCVISFLFQRLSMIVTALQLNSHYIFFLFHWRRSGPIASSDICFFASCLLLVWTPVDLYYPGYKK